MSEKGNKKEWVFQIPIMYIYWWKGGADHLETRPVDRGSFSRVQTSPRGKFLQSETPGGCLSSFHAAQASFTTIPFKYLEVYFLTRAPESSQSVVRNLTGYLAISSFWYSFVPFRFQIRWNLKLWYRYWNFHWLEPKLLTVVGTKILQCLSSFGIFSFAPTLVYFQWKYLKGIGCERDLLHGMSSNYLQTAGKRNLFMHICEGKFWLLNLMLGFGVELCFEILG